MRDNRRAGEFFAYYVVIHGLGLLTAQLYQIHERHWSAIASLMFGYPLFSLMVGMAGCGILAANLDRWEVRRPLLLVLLAMAICLALPFINYLLVRLIDSLFSG